MNDRQEFDVEGIVQHIREDLRSRRKTSSQYMPETGPEDGRTAAELAALQSNHDIHRMHFTSHRRAFGWLVVLTKQLLRQLLTPILERQVAYNTANMRISSRLWARLQETSGQLQETHERQAMLQSKVEALAYQHWQLRAEIGAVGQRQASALQALQAAVTAQTEGWGEQQRKSIQALQDTIILQIQGIGRHLADLELRLAELERAMNEVRSSLDN